MTDSVFQGLPVWSCFPGSPADRAGVKQGDVVVIANGHRVQTMQEYVDARRLRKDKLELTVLRGRQLIEFCVSLAPATTSDNTAPEPGRKAEPRDLT